jgi:hypothetical protein
MGGFGGCWQKKAKLPAIDRDFSRRGEADHRLSESVCGQQFRTTAHAEDRWHATNRHEEIVMKFMKIKGLWG